EPRDPEDRLRRGYGRRQGGPGAIPARGTDQSRKTSGRREQVQGGQMPLRHAAPMRGLLATVFVCALVAPAASQPKKGSKVEAKPAVAEKPDAKKEPKVKNFDFTGLDLSGRMR